MLDLPPGLAAADGASEDCSGLLTSTLVRRTAATPKRKAVSPHKIMAVSCEATIIDKPTVPTTMALP
jgi:hypothetical protein